MKRGGRVRAALLALAMASLILPTALAGTAQAQATSSPPTADQVTPAQEALNKVASCMSGNSQTNVLFVIDESSSLAGPNGSDPGSKRSDALNVAIDGLANLQAASPTKTINVAADTFSDTYHEKKVDWGPADAAHIQQLKQFATVTVPDLNQGDGTNYGLAMQNALTRLDGQGTGACRVIFWFTDGGLYVGDGEEAANLAAYQAICQPGGVSDSVRASKTYLVALALFDSAASEITDQDRSRLQAIAEGKSPAGDVCGTSPVPEGQTKGAYLPISNADRLSRVFADAIARIGNYEPITDPVGCEGPQCPEGAVTFTVDPGVAAVKILAFATEGTPTYTVTPPDGSPQQVQPGQGRIGAAPSQVSTSSGTANPSTTVDLDVTDPANVGTWRFEVADGRADVQPWLKSGTRLALADPNQTLRADGATEVPVRLVREDGSGVDPATYNLDGPRAEAAGGGPVTVTSRGADGWVLTVPPVQTPTVPTSRSLGVTLGLKSKPSDERLETLEQIFELTTKLDPSYPVVASELTFPRADKTGPVTASLPVQGSVKGATKVCVGAAELRGPTGPLTLAPVPGTLDANNCLPLAIDERREIAFSTDVAEVADGLASGLVPMQLHPVQASDPVVTMQIPAALPLTRPPNIGPALLWIFLLMLAAAAVPIIIVGVLGKRALAKFTSGDVRCVYVPVDLSRNADGDWSATSPGLGILAVDPGEVRWQQVQQDAREVALAGAPLAFVANFEFIRTRSIGPIRRFPVLSVRASATATYTGVGGRVMASNRNPFSFDAVKAPASLRLEECWFLIADRSAVAAAQESGNMQAQLVAIGTGADFPAQDLPKRVLPVLVTRMVDEMQRLAGSPRAEAPGSPVSVPPDPDPYRPPDSRDPKPDPNSPW